MEVLTHSKRRAFQNCPRYFKHRYEDLLEPRIQRPGRRRGHAFGAAIYALSVPEFQDLSYMETITDAIMGAYEDVHPADQADQDEMEFELHALPQIVMAYSEIYNVKARREAEFYLPLKNPFTTGTSHTFVRGGKVDGLEMDGSQVSLIEDKLVSQISKVMIDHTALDLQTCEYVDALLDLGYPLPMVKFRHTRWPSIRRTKKETVDQFCQRFSIDLVERRDWYFTETAFYFPLKVLDDYRKGRWQTAKMIMEARRTDSWPQNTSRCMDYGKCEYLPLCLKQVDAEELYVVTEDNPELTGGSNGTEERSVSASGARKGSHGKTT